MVFRANRDSKRHRKRGRVTLAGVLPVQQPPPESLGHSAHKWGLPDSVMDNTEFTPLLLPNLEKQIVFPTSVFLAAQL